MNSKQVFTLASSVALAGGAFAFPGVAEAACPTPDPAPPVIPYKPASPSKQACSAADLKAFNDFIKANPNATFQQAEASLSKQSAGCAACVFTKDSDATWGPFVYAGNEGDAFTNYGACFERSAGGSAACGEAIQKSELCLGIVCPSGNAPACTSEDDRVKCVKAALADKNSCGKYDAVTACGGAPTVKALDEACNTSDERIAASCMMGATPDGGTSTSSSSSSSSTSSSGSSGASSSGSSGGSSSSSGGSSGDEPPGSSGGSSSSGCATTGTNENGSLVAALALVGAGLIGATRRRRKDTQR